MQITCYSCIYHSLYRVCGICTMRVSIYAQYKRSLCGKSKNIKYQCRQSDNRFYEKPVACEISLLIRTCLHCNHIRQHKPWQALIYSCAYLHKYGDYIINATGCLCNQEHMSRRRRQGASNYVERHLHLRAFSAFRIRTVLDYGEYPLR